ncbi:MAG: hypothetical protein KDK37_11280, partial [Leptospiraceae bacterium]|nr:hypothetical protein [Leptospiraceae bacterium]
PAWIISSTSTLLTREFIEVPHCGVLNVHEGKLPEYKGSACYFWMIYNGEAAGNVTFQYVSVALDEGDVILEGPPVPIEKDTSVFDLWKGLLLSHGSVWPHFLPYLEQGSPAPAARQRRNDFVAYSYPTRTVVRKIKAGGHRIMRFKDLLWILKMGFRG